MINKDRGFFQYKSGDLVYIFSPLTSQVCTVSHKVTIKYIGPVVIYKIIDPPYLLTYDPRWYNFKGTLPAQEILTCYHQNESRKCPKFG